eukprot:GILI01017613.1.p1 GENE.GILI01017613.1~~GILI01017613.1.p1  ORF type:complete len:317 (-),score=107.34 GILI01017613.1:19-969(-)
MAESAIISAQEFFTTSAPPANLEEVSARVSAFVSSMSQQGKKLICLTSGGTTVPLEKNTVRFIDNFSTGLRGAACAEHFLRQGYAVVFLAREGSAMPFLRHLAPGALTSRHLNNFSLAEDGSISVSGCPSFAAALADYALYKPNLLVVDFVSIISYIFYLRSISLVLAAAGARAMFFLAAAVSDFFIPESKMATHKIQSSEGPLELKLFEVPKMLKELTSTWAPNCFTVSFKLETDFSILESKARGAIAKYHVHLVVGNELHSRYNQVILYTATEAETITRDQPSDSQPASASEIEIKLVSAVTARHDAFIRERSE